MEVEKYMRLFFFVSACIIFGCCRASQILEYSITHDTGTIFFTLDNETGVMNVSGVGTIIDAPYGAYYNTLFPSNWRPYIKTVKVGDGITGIWNNAFKGCTEMTSIEIPNSVTSVGIDAFYLCNSGIFHEYQDALYLGNDVNPFYALIRPKSGITSCRINDKTRVIADEAFKSYTGLTSIEIPNSVTHIGNNAFSSCVGLASVQISNSVISIGYAAFKGCSGLTSVKISNSVRSIGSQAFYQCSGLKSVEIPPNSVLTSIGDGAFEGCSALTSIKIPNSVISIGSGAFYDCNELKSVEIPDSVTYISPNSFSDSFFKEYDNGLYLGTDVNEFNFFMGAKNTSVTSCAINSKTRVIASGAFYGMNGLTSIEIPNSVISMGDRVFMGCTGLTSVKISNSVTSIGSEAFYHCSGLTSVEIPPNSVLTSIGDRAFEGCSALTSIKIPNSVTSIGSQAFYDCHELKSIEIPDSVTSIESRAFGYSGLTKVIYFGRTDAGQRNVFGGCPELEYVMVTKDYIGSTFCGVDVRRVKPCEAGNCAECDGNGNCKTCNSGYYKESGSGYCKLCDCAECDGDGNCKVVGGNEEWEVHIEFQNLYLSASELDTAELLNIIHEMSGIDVSNMKIEVQSDGNGMVYGINIYLTDEISASDLTDIVNGCSSQNSRNQCEGILQYVSSVSFSRKNLFHDEGNLLVGMMNMIVMSLILTIMFL